MKGLVRVCRWVELEVEEDDEDVDAVVDENRGFVNDFAKEGGVDRRDARRDLGTTEAILGAEWAGRKSLVLY